VESSVCGRGSGNAVGLTSSVGRKQFIASGEVKFLNEEIFVDYGDKTNFSANFLATDCNFLARWRRGADAQGDYRVAKKTGVSATESERYFTR